jgi:hypothetical protein
MTIFCHKHWTIWRIHIPSKVEPGFIQEEYLQNFILIVDDASAALAEVKSLTVLR